MSLTKLIDTSLLERFKDKIISLIPTSASDVNAVASNQGVANAGKFLVVGNDGVVAPVTMSAWQGGNY